MANPFEDIPEHYPVNFIMDNFDFEKVHRYMTYGNWTWASCGGVPPISELKRCAKSLLEELRSRGDDMWSIGTGGFQANKRGEKLQLAFVIESWDEYDLEYLGEELTDGWQEDENLDNNTDIQ